MPIGRWYSCNSEVAPQNIASSLSLSDQLKFKQTTGYVLRDYISVQIGTLATIDPVQYSKRRYKKQLKIHEQAHPHL